MLLLPVGFSCALLALVLPAHVTPVTPSLHVPRTPSLLVMRGGPPPHAKKKKAKGAKRSKRPPARPITPAASPAPTEEQLRDAHMTTVREAVERHTPALLDQLASRGYGVIDDFLPATTVGTMRNECESLRLGDRMVPSLSTRWDDASASVVSYEKQNVLSTNLVGGESYAASPRLVEYCVSLVSALPPLLNARFDDARLSSAVHTNKLAVCLGDGSSYAKHYDNSGGDDARKLTVLLYLQQTWREELGGSFRMFADAEEAAEADGESREGVSVGHASALEQLSSGGDAAAAADGASGEGEDVRHACVDIAPLGGRLLAFWSDSMIHGVLPSHAASEAEHRWALTVWLHTDDPASISFDPDAEARHFGAARGEQGSESHRVLAG